MNLTPNWAASTLAQRFTNQNALPTTTT